MMAMWLPVCVLVILGHLHTTQTAPSANSEDFQRLIKLLKTVAEDELTDQEDNKLRSLDARANGNVCRRVVTLSESTGTIESPSFPSDYPDSVNCRWLIEAPSGYVIIFSFPDGIFLEPDDVDCSYDFLRIYDGNNKRAPELAAFCGEQSPVDTVSSTGDTVFIRFKTDGSVTNNGFRISYNFEEVQTSGSANTCSGVTEYTSSPGTVTSPGYPSENYGDNSNCGYKITAPDGELVEVTFTDFALEPEDSCLYDAVMLFDGPGDNTPLLGLNCGTNEPGGSTSTGNSIYIKFTSDHSINDRGFSFNWQFVPSDSSGKEDPACNDQRPLVLEREEGTIASFGNLQNRNYMDNSNCAWRIIVPANMRAHVHFEAFSLEAASQCRYDKVLLYDGYDDSDEVLGRYCGDSTPGDITASENIMYIVFSTDHSVTAPGFKVTFSAKEATSPGGGGGGNGGQSGECGMQSVEPKFGRIVGGQPAIPHSWPWQISMQYRNYPVQGGWGHWCGGSVIDSNWVITAAHCVADNPDKDLYRVVVGEHNRQDDTESYQQIINVAEVIMHESYSTSHYNNDIALFRLETAVTYSSEVSPVCLPEMDIPERTLCVITGWGETQGTADDIVLQQAQVPTISRSDCNQGDWYNGQITPQMMCAGYPEGRKDSCQGDSGGPLVCTTGGPWILHGVTSWGFGCAEPKKPGVYTKVARFTDWVESQTGIQF